MCAIHKQENGKFIPDGATCKVFHKRGRKKQGQLSVLLIGKALGAQRKRQGQQVRVGAYCLT